MIQSALIEQKNEGDVNTFMSKKKILCILLSLLLILLTFSGCGEKSENSVVIYSSLEEFRNDHLSKRMKEQFPDYNVTIQYFPSGKNVAKVKAEGKDATEADIILGVDSGYLNPLGDMLADLSSYDTSRYLDDTVDPNHKYLAWERYSGGIIVNKGLLEEKGLAVPKSYDDLLKPEYKDLIIMSNPHSSSTGYIFLKSLCNAWGEEKAFEYFDRLAENIYQFSSSGSGPVNALVQGEAAIGLGMTFQAVQEINHGADLEILYFDEGSPYSVSGCSVIDGRLEKPAVKEVYDFLMDTLCLEDKQNFSPESIFRDQDTPIENYPQDIPYSDMTGMDAPGVKDELLAKWKY